MTASGLVLKITGIVVEANTSRRTSDLQRLRGPDCDLIIGARRGVGPGPLAVDTARPLGNR